MTQELKVSAIDLPGQCIAHCHLRSRLSGIPNLHVLDRIGLLTMLGMHSSIACSQYIGVENRMTH